MEKQEKKLNIYQRMSEIMKEDTYIKKRAKKDGMRFNYVSHDDVSAKLHPLFVKHGVQPINTVMEYKMEGSNNLVKVAMAFINIDDPQDRIVVEGWGTGLDNQDKGYGKALSYAIKNIYLKTFVMESGDEDEVDAYQDDSHSTKKPEPVSKANPVLLSDKQADTIRQHLKDRADIREAIMKITGKRTIQEIEYRQFQEVMHKITEMKGVA